MSDAAKETKRKYKTNQHMEICFTFSNFVSPKHIRFENLVTSAENFGHFKISENNSANFSFS